jgi:guanylate kinase
MTDTAIDQLPGRLLVVSGPSGSGKSTLARLAVARPEVRARLSVSATTRPARPGERPGVDYYFLSRAEFESRQATFLEWAQVHGNFYGTPIAPVRAALESGECVLLEIDVQGGLQVKERVPGACLVFVCVPRFADLEARLRARATDDEATIQRRLDAARWELAQADRYDVRLVNEDIDRAVDDLVTLMVQLGCGGNSARCSKN